MKTGTVHQLFVGEFLIGFDEALCPENQWTFEKVIGIARNDRNGVHIQRQPQQQSAHCKRSSLSLSLLLMTDRTSLLER